MCGTKFSLLGLLVACAVQSSPCKREMAWYRRFVVCWESFVPGGSIGAACWESFIPVRPAGVSCGESFVPVVHLTCGAGGVLSRSSGETARSEGGARPAGPGRASRRRAERSSRRGRRAGGQASHRTEIWQASRRTEIWRGARSCSRDRLLLGPVLLSSHPQLVLL